MSIHRAARSVSAGLTALALTVGMTLTACGEKPASWQAAGSNSSPSVLDGQPSVAPSAAAQPSTSPTPKPSATPAAKPVAPKAALAVGVRTLNLSRGGRSLPSTVWYPATGRAGGSPKANAPAAAGRFPVVLFSHGLHGLPAYYQQIATRFAAAGFVVAAPTYPFTNQNAKPFNAGDTVNQPVDASYVLTEVLKLDGRAGDLLAGHLDKAAVGAAGHSAGGFTTAGMLADKRDTRLKGAIVIAGGAMGAFRGPSTPVLFVHGAQDNVVGYPTGRSAYTNLKWPKAFLTLVGQRHGEYLGVGARGFDQMMKTMIDFLRWTLYRDPAARARLSADGNATGVTTFESRL